MLDIYYTMLKYKYQPNSQKISVRRHWMQNARKERSIGHRQSPETGWRRYSV